MADRRIKAPRLMSKAELADHMVRFHGSDPACLHTRGQHDMAHRVQKANHTHRSARLSEPTHPDWM